MCMFLSLQYTFIVIYILFYQQFADNFTSDFIYQKYKQTNKQTNSVVWVRERTIPTEQPPLVGKGSPNFFG
jgi:hypothetical protein